MKRILLATSILGALALGACTTAQIATTTTTITQAEADATIAVTAYQTALGVAEVAVLKYPTLQPTLTKIEAIAGPVIAQLTPLETDVSADVPTIEALVATLNTQAAALLAGAGGSVTVVAK